MNGRTLWYCFKRLQSYIALAGLLLAAGCATSGTGESAITVTAPTAIVAVEGTPAPPTATSTPTSSPASPTSTATPTPTRPTATPAPIITATPPPTPVLVGLDNTLVLYTALTAIRPNVDPNTYWDPHYGFKTWPPLPYVDPAVFDPLYGKRENMGGDIDMFFMDRRAHASPDGRYVLVPGLHASPPEYGVAGTGTWLLDLAAGEARQLLPDGVIATWSPAGDAITYVDGGALYTLSVAPGATPRALLTDENLWPLFAKWSPNGDTIATLISTEPDTTDPNDTRYFVGLWLVPVDGAPPRPLSKLEVFGMEYASQQVAWSPDGQYLLALNDVYDLDGNRVSPDFTTAVTWLPEGSRLLTQDMDIITVAGELVTDLDDARTFAEWAFSHDGRRVAVFRGDTSDGPFHLAVYDLASGENWDVRDRPPGIVRWSADDSRLILGVYELQNGERPQIVTVSAAPGGAGEQLLLDYAQLIEVVEYPPRE